MSCADPLSVTIVRRWRPRHHAPDANWPQTLRGEPADIFARWRQELEPKGFRLAAQIVESRWRAG